MGAVILGCVPERSQRISETSRPNSIFVGMNDRRFSAVAQGDGGIDAGCAARGDVGGQHGDCDYR
jgi:hypothetical protein